MTEQLVELRRPFAWGVLLVGDASDARIPSVPAEGSISRSATQVAIPVRHEQDVALSGDNPDEITPFAVRLSCSGGTAQSQALEFDDVIELPSGRLAIGDADRVETVGLSPGRWRIQVAMEPAHHAEVVRVWYSRAASL